MNFSQPYRNEFIDLIKSFTNEDLQTIEINRADLTELGHTGYIRKLGDMLLRYAYHEAVHTGQMLDYLRTAGIDRPDIWD